MFIHDTTNTDKGLKGKKALTTVVFGVLLTTLE